MAFDFSKIRAQKSGERRTDPVALFQSLRVTDTSINDLWLAQGDALRRRCQSYYLVIFKFCKTVCGTGNQESSGEDRIQTH